MREEHDMGGISNQNEKRSTTYLKSGESRGE